MCSLFGSYILIVYTMCSQVRDRVDAKFTPQRFKVSQTPLYSLGLTQELKAQCLHNVINFAHRRGLCGSPHTPEQAFISCANRCGRTKYIGSFLKCACDDRCLVYKDCCDDMESQCPETYMRGKKTYDFLDEADTVCKELTFIVNREAGSHRQTHPPPPSSDLSTTPTFLTDLKLNLQQLFLDVRSFLVADTKFGIIVDNSHTPSSWGIPANRLAFVPRVTTLACMKTDLVSPLLGILQSCTLTAMQDILTSLHRSCKFETVVSCQCGKSHVISGFLQDACLHQNQSHFLYDTHSDSERAQVGCTYNNLQPYARGPADLEINGMWVLKPMTGTIGRLQSAVPVKLTPVILSADAPKAGSVYESHYNPVDTDGDEMGVFDHHRDSLDSLPLEFVVELETTLEKRLRCSRFKGHLSECHLEECTQAALLLTKSSFYWAYKGNTCMIPLSVTVTDLDTKSAVTVCTCFQVANALGSFKVWDVKVAMGRQDYCKLRLEHLPQSKIEFFCALN